MIHVLEFIGRVIFSILIFSTCLSLMWFITWVLILQHVNFFREIVIGKNTPQHSPAQIPSGLSKRTPKNNNFQKISPVSSNGNRSRPNIKSIPQSPLLLPPPSPLILPPPIIHTPENDVFYALGPPMTPEEKMRLLLNKKTSLTVLKQTSIISPCNVPTFIHDWFNRPENSKRD